MSAVEASKLSEVCIVVGRQGGAAVVTRRPRTTMPPRRRQQQQEGAGGGQPQGGVYGPTSARKSLVSALVIYASPHDTRDDVRCAKKGLMSRAPCSSSLSLALWQTV